MPGIMVSASTGAMNSLLGKLTTLMGEEFAKLKNLRKEVKFISDELGSMKDALERLADVEKLDPQTKSWRHTLREISYDIEDIIDDFMQNIGVKHKNSGFVRKTIRHLKTLRFRHRIAGQIKEIKKLVHETNDRRKRYQLDNIIPPSSNSVEIVPRVKTLYEKAAHFVGMKGPRNELVNWLKVEEKQLKVVTIVGFGGLGKTTLANEVYRMLRGEFDCAAFVPVYQKPNIPYLLRGLLSQLGVEPSIHACESHLIYMLREHLQTKRYLIIIDDLWDVSAWDIIKCAFPENDLCSRIIATTRIENVVTTCCSHRRDHIFKMKPLSDEDSRRLFFDRIFGSEEACPPHLGDVSVEILKKCSGLPLAIISISSMLASDGSIKKERWEDVHNCLYSGTNFTLEGMGQILNLSYKDLPCHLKTCLLFVGMHPEDYIIQRSDLQRQWLAEGFINKENGQDVEKVARNYFNELVNRSLIQPIVDNRGSVTQCGVHDMMLDLILLKSEEENFFTIVNGRQPITGLAYKVRRLSIRMDGATNDQRLLQRNISMSQVRSVMFFGRSQNTPPLSEFKFLRVLFIDLTYGTVDLSGLCKLYQLRYLRIRCSCPYKLPTHIRVLQDLETLDLFNCYNLPSDLVHLPRLVHLNVNTWLPDGIGNMKSLQHLDLFDLVSNTIDDINGLGELTNLRYLILGGILPPDDKETRMDALCSSLGKLCSLEYLYVNLEDCIDGLMPVSPPTPHRLETLLLSHKCWFSRVPSWLGQLRNLCQLQCQVVELLNDGVGILAELPVLTDIDIRILKNRNEMIVIYGRAFPALKNFSLLLSSASYLTFKAGSMSKLQRLKLLFSANGSEQNGIAPTGIKHLLSLEELSAQIHYNGAWESDKTSIESAFRSAISMHPSSPRLEIWVD